MDQAADVTGVKVCLSAKQFSINHEASVSHCSDVNKPESEHLKNSLVYLSIYLSVNIEF